MAAELREEFDIEHDVHQLWWIDEVREHVEMSEARIHELMARGEFPQSVRISRTCVGWLAREVRMWQRARVEASRSQVKKPRACQRRVRAA